MPLDYHKFIECRPEICGGEPVIKGTRVTVRTILTSLAEGASVEQVIADFPTVTPEAVRAIIAFAAIAAGERLTSSADDAFALHEPAAPVPVVRGLPDDLAVNHDYYLHGHQHKQQPRKARWIPEDKPLPEMTAPEAADCTSRLLGFAAECEALPADLAANHDYYLHGLPQE